ncbi:MAG TPA: caspase family protein [Kofleriaceae bacterium]
MHRDLESMPLLPPSATAAGRSVIAVIGINQYHAWPRLSNAVSDAEGAARLFERLGFVEVTRLIDGAATREALHRLVTGDLIQLTPDDSLVLFFAGHGHTQVRTAGGTSVKTGYVIPVDAADGSQDAGATWLRLDNWLSDIARLPPRHILVIIDACHSGCALNELYKWRDGTALSTTQLEVLRARRSRRIITSALDDQRAMDSGPYLGHSLFTGCLIEGLSGGLARGEQCVTTGRELGEYLHKRVRNFPGSMQTPDVGAFELDDRGDIVIPILSVEQASASVPTQTAPSPQPIPVPPLDAADGRRRTVWFAAGAGVIVAAAIAIVVVATRGTPAPAGTPVAAANESPEAATGPAAVPPPSPAAPSGPPPAAASPLQPAQPADEVKPLEPVSAAAEPSPQRPAHHGSTSSRPAVPASGKRHDAAPAEPARDAGSNPTERTDVADEPARHAESNPTEHTDAAAEPPARVDPKTTAANPDVPPKGEMAAGSGSAAPRSAASKWGRLMDDKTQGGTDDYLFASCKTAATNGNCDLAKAIAARIAEKNIALYRTRVLTDAAIAACLTAQK